MQEQTLKRLKEERFDNQKTFRRFLGPPSQFRRAPLGHLAGGYVHMRGCECRVVRGGTEAAARTASQMLQMILFCGVLFAAACLCSGTSVYSLATRRWLLVLCEQGLFVRARFTCVGGGGPVSCAARGCCRASCTVHTTTRARAPPATLGASSWGGRREGRGVRLPVCVRVYCGRSKRRTRVVGLGLFPCGRQ